MHRKVHRLVLLVFAGAVCSLTMCCFMQPSRRSNLMVLHAHAPTDQLLDRTSATDSTDMYTATTSQHLQAQEHAELDGVLVQAQPLYVATWQACRQCCIDDAATTSTAAAACNIWVFCPTGNSACKEQPGQCWLKYGQASAWPAMRRLGPLCPWVSGTLWESLSQAEAEAEARKGGVLCSNLHASPRSATLAMVYSGCVAELELLNHEQAGCIA